MAGVQTLGVQIAQSKWLKDWHRYLVKRFATGPTTALEVGCGEGYVMSNLSDILQVKGVDLDKEQAINARKRGLDVEAMDGLDLRFDDGSFDLVLCSFYLMWVKDPKRAIDEMLRVSRNGALVLNEPIWSRSIYAPEGLKELVDGWTSVIRKDGGDPDAGSKVAEIVGQMGGRFGIVPGEMDKVEMRRNIEFEKTVIAKREIILREVEPIIFQVPYVWGYVPKQTDQDDTMSNSS